MCVLIQDLLLPCFKRIIVLSLLHVLRDFSIAACFLCVLCMFSVIFESCVCMSQVSSVGVERPHNYQRDYNVCVCVPIFPVETIYFSCIFYYAILTL